MGKGRCSLQAREGNEAREEANILRMVGVSAPVLVRVSKPTSASASHVQSLLILFMLIKKLGS